MEGFLDFLQWPAMAVSLYAAFLIGSKKAGKRIFGFWMFILSNVCGSSGACTTRPGR